MADEPVGIDTEIADYIVDLDNWVQVVSAAKARPSRAGVLDRFKRDCITLKGYMFENKAPSHDDLNDYSDRHASLEIQFNNLNDDLT